jgi:NAD(P)-dependent dehydrogenase (short-subunit alcohol dehydrogenase family)
LSSAGEDVTKRVQTCALDLKNQDTIDDLEEYLKSHHNKRVDGLFNVAGILGDGKNTPGPERSLAHMDREWLEHSFQVNVIGHVMLIKALKTMMRSKGSSKTPARPITVIVNLSARVGSISDNGLGYVL